MLSQLNALTYRRETWFLGAMLILLHSALWGEFGDALSGSLLLAHFGIFLLWQPIWQREQRLGRSAGIVIFGAAVTAMYLLNWWGIFFWLLLLIGLVGGRITGTRTERYVYLATLLFLMSELLIRCVPELFGIPLQKTPFESLFHYGLMALPVTLVFIQLKPVSDKAGQLTDFLNGLILSLLTGILALGSLVVMYYTGAPYADAVFRTLIAIALFLFVISWLWLPHAKFSGIGQIWAANLLNIGTPFEEWLVRMSNAAQVEQTPSGFLSAAMRIFVDLPWVAGAEWECRGDADRAGTTSNHQHVISAGNIRVTVHAHTAMGVTLLLHGKLLIQLIAHFYHGKLSEQQLATQAHLRAIHETGARVTHDIKNLLQSMHNLSEAVQSDGDSGAVQQLLRKHLPGLTERLHLALDKLQAPDTNAVEYGPLKDWWNVLQSRSYARNVNFESVGDADVQIPVDIFDSAADNLLENARIKRQSEPDIEITVRLVVDATDISLTVSDTGKAMDRNTERNLFEQPVSSSTGLGVGLYQAAQQAAPTGFVLALKENRDGNVCFELSGKTTQGASSEVQP